MKKNLLLAGLLTTFSLVAKSQVGINTTAPAATLDVTAKNSTGTTTTVEGLLIPRVDRQRAQSMTGVPTSTLIYVNSIATGTASGTALNIDAVGYYYYNGTVWTKLNPTFNPVNLYNADGTLTGNRTVTQGANTLAFTGTQTNAFSVDGTTLSVDAANNRVGVGTTTPASLLSVQNTPGATTNTISAGIENCGTPCGQGVSRNITLYNLNSTGGEFAELGFVPSTSETGLSGATITGIDRDAANNYAGLQFFTRNATDFAPRMTIKSSGNIGIGTTNPTNKLQIESGTSGALKIVDGTQGTDKVLTSDANGVATWKVLPAAPASTNIYNTDGTLTGNRTVTQGANTLAFTGTQTNAFSVDGSTFSIDAANDRIGIGTTTPANKLTISTPDNNYGFNHTNGTVELKTYIGGGSAYIGTTTSNNLNLMTNNGARVVITPTGNVGIGTATPSTSLEINSGSTGVSGLKFTSFNSNTPVGTGQAIGVDSSGNVITVSTSAQITTVENAISTPPGPSTFNVTDLGYTTVPGSVQNITIPAGGKALFINFMLGIDYTSTPTGGGVGFYQAILFVDNTATNVYQTVQESGPGAQAQFNLSSVRFLNAGSHTVDVRMIRKYNNGTTSGATMACTPISVSFNSSYVN